MKRLVLLPLSLLVLAGCSEEPEPPPHLRVVGGEPARGRELIAAYGCGACHRIPGVPHAQAMVGPPLDDYAQRGYVAGLLPNRAANLIAWLQDPPAIRPGTAMPDLGVDEAEARHIAAYLYTLGAEGAVVYPPGPQPPRR